MERPRYGFYDRLSAKFPSQIIVDVTEICNLECVHCPHPAFKKSLHYGNRTLTADLNAKLADEVREHGAGITQYIRYTSNGEPLANLRIYEMLAYSARHAGTTVCLTTNGTLMNERNLGRLLETGVDLIDISIDAFHDETYAKVRVKGDLAVTRANVQNLIRRRHEAGKAPKVVVSYVEQPLNQGETKDFEAFWKDQGADYVVIRKLHSASGAVPAVAEVMHRETSEPRRPCLYPWERISLNPKGYLAFCPSDWVHGSDIADYRETTIHEVWQSDFYQRLRQAHLCNNYEKHAFCGQCPDWKNTVWPAQGRSYANMVSEFTERA